MLNPALPINENLESIRKALAGTNKYFPKITSFDDLDWIAASKESCEYLLKLVQAYRHAAIGKSRYNVSCEMFDSEVQKRMEESK